MSPNGLGPQCGTRVRRDTLADYPAIRPQRSVTEDSLTRPYSSRSSGRCLVKELRDRERERERRQAREESHLIRFLGGIHHGEARVRSRRENRAEPVSDLTRSRVSLIKRARLMIIGPERAEKQVALSTIQRWRCVLAESNIRAIGRRSPTSEKARCRTYKRQRCCPSKWMQKRIAH